MKNIHKTIRSRLEDLPNVGKAIADRLRLIGIHHPQELRGQNPLKLYEDLCRASQTKQDPCVLDTFMSVVHFIEGGEALPWWAFTKQRKKILREKNIQDNS